MKVQIDRSDWMSGFFIGAALLATGAVIVVCSALNDRISKLEQFREVVAPHAPSVSENAKLPPIQLPLTVQALNAKLAKGVTQ